MSFSLNRRALADLERSEAVKNLLDEEAKKIQNRARNNARPISSDLAEAIVAEPATEDTEGVYADIGYDKNHRGFALWWHEVGTVHYPATPHLRPAMRGQ